MAVEETVVLEKDLTEEKDNAEANAAAKPETGGDADPQAKPEHGEESDEQRQKRKGGWARQNERLKAENAELRRQMALAQPISEPKEADDPEPDQSKYEDLIKYNRDLALWAGRQAFREARSKESEAQKAERAKSEYQSKAEKFRSSGKELHADFEEVVFDPSLTNFTPSIVDAVLDSDAAPAIGYHLATHPAELAKLAKLSPAAQNRAIGKLEAQFAQEESDQDAEEVEAKKDPPAAPVSRAPKPAVPPGKPSSAKLPSIHDPDLPYKEFVKLREAQKKDK